jgi:ATP-dependent exoDNAse (exonuclease V) beta subunit
MRKEWEFVDVQENEMLHGVIDLLIDEGESYTIIDYKLKGIDDSAYDEQLNGYRHSIEKKTQKKVRCYLYSLFEEEYREVKDA